MMRPNPKQDKLDEIELFKNRVMYSLPVHAGEWLNQLAIREQFDYLHASRKRNCALIIQKTRKIFRNLLRPISLDSGASYVRYRKHYQIQAIMQPLSLSVIISDREIDTIQNLIHGCVITAAPNSVPVARNTFEFINCENLERDGPLLYGVDLFIKSAGSDDDMPLYVQCENATMDSFGGPLVLKLSKNPDNYCRFKLIHWNPQIRNETDKTSVIFKEIVIIKHTASGHNLAVQPFQQMPTFFGAEVCVICQTFRDTHRMETGENFWKIVGEETKTIVK